MAPEVSPKCAQTSAWSSEGAMRGSTMPMCSVFVPELLAAESTKPAKPRIPVQRVPMIPSYTVTTPSYCPKMPSRKPSGSGRPFTT